MRHFRLIAVALALPGLLAAGSLVLPHSFTNGQMADAQQMNANFGALSTAVNALQDGTSSITTRAGFPPGCAGGTGAGHIYWDTAASQLRICDGYGWRVAQLSGRVQDAMPVAPVQFIEFAQVSNPAQTATWDQTGATRTIVNNMTWAATEKAYQASGTLSSYIDTGWKVPPGAKTACMWKKFYNEANMTGAFGLDGWQVNPGYFYFGSHLGAWYFFSGSNGGVATGEGMSPGGPTVNEWVFYCMASSGNNGSTRVYTAVPGDAAPVLRHSQASNGSDPGHLGDTKGMRYGVMSSDAYASKAYYGGFIHFEQQLSAAEVRGVYDATKAFYPGHGGTR